MMAGGKFGNFLLNPEQSGNEIFHPRSYFNQQSRFGFAIQATGIRAGMIEASP